MKRSKGQTWRVELQCPQCCGPVTLEETDRILSCSFCRVRLFIVCRGHSSYYLAPAAGCTEETYFVPYWRFKGILFSCKGTEIQQKIVDSSRLAATRNWFPISLGVRAQVLQLKFVAPETEGKFLEPDVPFETVLMEHGEGPGVASDRGKKQALFHQAFIGETVSLVYSPVFFKGNVVYDAVLERPLRVVPGNLEQAIKPPMLAEQPPGSLSFTPTLCPHCGWDLQGQADTLVMLCRNCDSAWEVSDAGLKRVIFAGPPGSHDGAVYLPFWKLRGEVAGLELRSYADLVSLANLPKKVKMEWHSEGFHFWLPAFKVNPQLFLRLAKILTITQLRATLQEKLPGSASYPVTLPLREAAGALKVVVASMAVPRRQIFPILGASQVQIHESLLVYLPFVVKGSEMIQPELQISINRNALELGRLI